MKLLLPNTTHSSSSSNLKSLFFSPYPVKIPSSPNPHKPNRWPPMAATINSHHLNSRLHRREKVVVIMGATGCGKSRLSIDLASLFPSEIINSDKMQVYKGLDITTNKIPPPERLGVPHHLLGSIDPQSLDGELTPTQFRSFGHALISDIASRQNLPLVVGGSNSFIYALLAERFDPGSLPDVFDRMDSVVTSELRYNCCFLWVDVSMPILDEYLSKRVDDMLDEGMFEELVRYYNPDRAASANWTGLWKAIGVPEFDRFFRKYPPGSGTWKDEASERAYKEAVREIKENTLQLARRQIGKIQRLRGGGWDLRRLDATEAFRVVMTPESSEEGRRRRRRRWAEVWESQVLWPSIKIVKRFLEEQ